MTILAKVLLLLTLLIKSNIVNLLILTKIYSLPLNGKKLIFIFLFEMKKIFLLKLDKNQNCRSFTHESLAIPRSDHHSHSLFGLMGLVVVGGVGRVGVKGPEYEKL